MLRSVNELEELVLSKDERPGQHEITYTVLPLKDPSLLHEGDKLACNELERLFLNNRERAIAVMTRGIEQDKLKEGQSK